MIRIEVPGYEGRGYEIKAGQLLRIIDVEGQQIADWIAFNSDDPLETLSGPETLNLEWRTRPKVGSRFWSSKRRPMFEVVSDDAGGVHDMTHAPCSNEYYEVHAGISGHPNCRDNLLNAVRGYGITDATLPNTVNLFQNTPLGPDGSTDSKPGVTKPGDGIVLRALMDCFGAVSACSVDVDPPASARTPNQEPINAGGSTPVLIEVLDERELANAR